MRRALLIVDVQPTFCEGGELPVAGQIRELVGEDVGGAVALAVGRPGVEDALHAPDGHADGGGDVPVGVAVGRQLLRQSLTLELTDPDVVERHIRVHVGAVQDQPVIADHRDVLLLGQLNHRRRRGGIDRVENHHVGTIGQRRLHLAMLLRSVLVGVAVDHVAVRAEVLDRRLELRVIVGLVPGRLRLRQEEGDLGPPTATAATRPTGSVVLCTLTGGAGAEAVLHPRHRYDRRSVELDGLAVDRLDSVRADGFRELERDVRHVANATLPLPGWPGHPPACVQRLRRLLSS